jgi:hypothetical protein
MEGAYRFHPLFGGGGCLSSAIFGGLRMLSRALWPATVIDG